MKVIKVEPFEESIEPAIVFTVVENFQKWEKMLVKLEGWLLDRNDRILTPLKEIKVSSPETVVAEIAGKGTVQDKNFQQEKKCEIKFIAFLSGKILDHIENLREKDPKKDVKLKLRIIKKFLVSKAEITHFHEANPKDYGLKSIRGESIITYKYDKNYSPSRTDLWIISGNSGPVFLQLNEACEDIENIRIPSADWIHDFAPKLGLGEHYVIEIPKGEKIIKEAWDYIEKAEKAFMEWNIESVFTNCREAGKKLDKAIKKKFGEGSFTYNERWGRAYIRFFNYVVSLGLHLEDMRDKNWEELIKNFPLGFPRPKKRGDYPDTELKRFGRADAQHAIITTKALIKYAEDLLRE